MALTQLKYIDDSFQSPIQLDQPYSLDVWPIKEWDIYKTANKKDQKYFNDFGYEDSSFDFSKCAVEAIRTEFKYFLYNCIVSKGCTLRTVTEHFSRGTHIFSYIKENPSVRSVLDIDVYDYTSFLLKTKRIDGRYVGDGFYLNGDMEKVPIKRKNRTINLLSHIQRIIEEVYEEKVPEQTRDYWRLKNFAFLDQDRIPKDKNLDFRKIPQKEIREIAKKVFYVKLKYERPSTLYNKLHSLAMFLKWLDKKHGEIKNLKDLNRSIMEEYLEYMRVESGCSDSIINKYILNVKRYLEDGYLIDKEHFPENNLILNTDYRIRPIRNAGFYSDTEIKNINRALPDMPVMYASIVLCLELLALRISDLIMLTPSMIEEVPKSGLYQYQLDVSRVLIKAQQKTNNMIAIPLSDSIYKVLMNQIKISKEKYGDDVKYIFATGKNKHISLSAIGDIINKYFYNLGVKSDSGDILRFKSHKFRSTKAIKYINEGFGSAEAAKTLGHASLQSLSYYVTVTDDALIDNLEPFINKAQIIIENMGNGVKQIEKETEKLLPLCNGWCCRPASMGICEHANKCLSCSLFKPDGRHISYYKLQLQELEATLGTAKAMKNTSLITKTEKDITAVERIIKEVEKLCKQRET